MLRVVKLAPVTVCTRNTGKGRVGALPFLFSGRTGALYSFFACLFATKFLTQLKPMPQLDAFLASPSFILVLIIMTVAALAHGTLGFGFPVISTPMIAMMTDIKTAILTTLFPNIVINLVSIIRGGNWRLSIGKYWPVAVYVLIGTVAGTHVLIAADPEPLKLLLAFMIVVYLQQARFRKLDWSWLKRRPRASAPLFGLLAGFLSGTVNVAVPPLVIYFLALGLAPLAMTQILNLCFLVGKSTQAVTFGVSGQIGLITLIATAPLTIISVAALLFGMRIQNRIHPEAYQQLLRKVLWAMVLILVMQVGWHYLR